jgi:hypothetical protein
VARGSQTQRTHPSCSCSCCFYVHCWRHQLQQSATAAAAVDNAQQHLQHTCGCWGVKKVDTIHLDTCNLHQSTTHAHEQLSLMMFKQIFPQRNCSVVLFPGARCMCRLFRWCCLTMLVHLATAAFQLDSKYVCYCCNSCSSSIMSGTWCVGITKTCPS